MKRPRPLTPTETQQLATDLTRLAAILTRPDIHRILAGIATAATPGYPRTASGTQHTPTSTGNGDLLDCLTDPTTTYAAALLTDLHRLRLDTPTAATALTGWFPERAVAKCPVCDYPYDNRDRESKRCRKVIDGIPCQASIDADPLCRDCGEPMPKGDRHGGRHDACRQFKTRNGYTKATMATYAAALEGAIIVDGVGHA